MRWKHMRTAHYNTQFAYTLINQTVLLNKTLETIVENTRRVAVSTCNI